MISREQIRAARAWLNLGQQDVAQGIGVSSQTISDIENERTNPKASILADLQNFFEIKGIEFLEDGGVRKSKNFVKVYEGVSCYIDFLNDAHTLLAPKKGEIFFSGANERRSPDFIIEKFRSMRADGISMRSLINKGDTYYMGEQKEYRCISESLYIDTDVKIIYLDRVAWLASWLGTPRVIMIQDGAIAQEAVRVFEYIWDQSVEPAPSTSEVFY
jgi:DNA-binding XRE family transcriptional regulator